MWRMEGPDERMGVVLGPATRAQARAAQTLLEGLALWQQQALCVVPCADVGGSTSPHRLQDALGFGVRNEPFEVEVALRHGQRRARRISTLGSLGDLRQVHFLGVMP